MCVYAGGPNYEAALRSWRTSFRWTQAVTATPLIDFLSMLASLSRYEWYLRPV